MDTPNRESHLIPIGDDTELHLTRWVTSASGPPLLLMHGSISNGKIFYTKSGKGLAPYLALKGYDVYVPDLRGRGESRPEIDRHARFGQTEAIVEDIPAIIAGISDINGSPPRHWIAHSWGGVLLLAYYARFADLRPSVRSIVFIGTKRCIRSRSLSKLLVIDIYWKRIATLIACFRGFLPKDILGRGTEAETRRSLADNISWITPGPWLDPFDGFDYGKAIRSLQVPPILTIASSSDRYLGNPDDVDDFMDEVGAKDWSRILTHSDTGVEQGFSHTGMLVDERAPVAIFPSISDWIAEHE